MVRYTFPYLVRAGAVAVIGERVREGRDSVGRKLIDVPGYTFRVFVTRGTDAPEEIWRDYNRRADMENRIAELKHDLGADGFCLKQFFATEAAFRACCCCSTCWASSNGPPGWGGIASRRRSAPRFSPAARSSVARADESLSIYLKRSWKLPSSPEGTGARQRSERRHFSPWGFRFGTKQIRYAAARKAERRTFFLSGSLGQGNKARGRQSLYSRMRFSHLDSTGVCSHTVPLEAFDSGVRFRPHIGELHVYCNARTATVCPRCSTGRYVGPGTDPANSRRRPLGISRTSRSPSGQNLSHSLRHSPES